MAQKQPNPAPTTEPPKAPPAPPPVLRVLDEIHPALARLGEEITKKTAPTPAPMPYSPPKPKTSPRKAIKTKPPRTAELTKEQRAGLPPSAKQIAEAERIVRAVAATYAARYKSGR